MPRSSPENRDELARRQAAHARSLGLEGPAGHFGPGNFVRRPTAAEDDLALRLGRQALRALTTADPRELPYLEIAVLGEDARPELKGTRLDKARVATPTSIPEYVDHDAATLGLPLLLTLAPALMEPALHLLQQRRSPGQNPNRSANRELSERLFRLEDLLWGMSRKYGAPAGHLPFASRLRALRWWWEPDAGRVSRTALCVRCGWLVITRQRRSGAPFCSHCEDDRRLEHPRAIAPHERGTWWLLCAQDDCSHAFVGRLQARFCPEHQASRMTPSRRRTTA